MNNSVEVRCTESLHCTYGSEDQCGSRTFTSALSGLHVYVFRMSFITYTGKISPQCTDIGVVELPNGNVDISLHDYVYICNSFF